MFTFVVLAFFCISLFICIFLLVNRNKPIMENKNISQICLYFDIWNGRLADRQRVLAYGTNIWIGVLETPNYDIFVTQYACIFKTNVEFKSKKIPRNQNNNKWNIWYNSNVNYKYSTMWHRHNQHPTPIPIIDFILGQREWLNEKNMRITEKCFLNTGILLRCHFGPVYPISYMYASQSVYGCAREVHNLKVFQNADLLYHITYNMHTDGLLICLCDVAHTRCFCFAPHSFTILLFEAWAWASSMVWVWCGPIRPDSSRTSCIARLLECVCMVNTCVYWALAIAMIQGWLLTLGLSIRAINLNEVTLYNIIIKLLYFPSLAFICGFKFILGFIGKRNVFNKSN